MIFFENSEVEELIKKGLVVSGVKGGLVAGNLHENGGVPIIHGNFEIGFYYYAEMEGFEFVVNRVSSQKYKDELIHLNNKMSELENKYQFIDLFNLITNQNPELVYLDLRSDEKSLPFQLKYLHLIDGEFIVNRFSTMAYIKRIIEINENCFHLV